MGGWVYIEFWRGLIYKPKIEIISCQQSQIHKICLVLSSSALPWFHTGRVRISVVWLISLHCLHCVHMLCLSCTDQQTHYECICSLLVSKPKINSGTHDLRSTI